LKARKKASIISPSRDLVPFNSTKYCPVNRIINTIPITRKQKTATKNTPTKIISSFEPQFLPRKHPLLLAVPAELVWELDEGTLVGQLEGLDGDIVEGIMDGGFETKRRLGVDVGKTKVGTREGYQDGLREILGVANDGRMVGCCDSESIFVG
jgi:hypothetical protein